MIYFHFCDRDKAIGWLQKKLNSLDENFIVRLQYSGHHWKLTKKSAI